MTRSVDFGGDLFGRFENWDPARNRVHEDFGPAFVADVLQGGEERYEVEVTSTRHLQEFLFFRKFDVASHSVLPGVEHSDVSAE